MADVAEAIDVRAATELQAARTRAYHADTITVFISEKGYGPHRLSFRLRGHNSFNLEVRHDVRID